MENVLLIFGGRSYEHDISIVTASQIFLKTKIKDINLVPLYVSKNNKFFVYQNEKFNLKDFVDFDEVKVNKNFKEVQFLSNQKGVIFAKTAFGIKELLRTNIAINVCHGGNGENGRLVAFFEELGIFLSSGSCEGLGISMDKTLFKTIMKGAKLPVVKGFEISKNIYEKNKQVYENKLKFAKFPLVIKPVSGGSSLGLFIAKTRDEFEKMLSQAFEFDSNVLVENFVANSREFNVAVVGDVENFEVSEIDEPLKLSEVLSFEDKYLSGGKGIKESQKNGSMALQKRKFPAEIDVILREKIRSIAAKTFSLLRLSGVVRIDFLYDEINNKLYVCEVNSVPGSLSYYFFARGEVLINDFVKKLIEIAKCKFNQQKDIRIDFITKVLN